MLRIFCLAGFMRLPGPDFAARWRDRPVDVRPSLLPAFEGLDTHARALAEERRIYPLAVRWIAEGRVRVAGEAVVVDGGAERP